MRQKVFRIVVTMVITILFVSTCNESNVGMAALSYSFTRPTIAELPVPSLPFQNIMTKHFLKDAKVPIGVYKKLKMLKLYSIKTKNKATSVMYVAKDKLCKF